MVIFDSVLYLLLILTLPSLVMSTVLERNESSQALKRKHRQIDKNGLTDYEREDLLDKHNALRRLEEATAMLEMVWDPALEAHAQAYASKCDNVHSIENQAGTFVVVGENLFATSAPTIDVNYVMQVWYDEVMDYTYATGTCSKICGHYTQMVWATTNALGCGITYCKQLLNAITFDRGYLVVCNYGPAGNINDWKPYVKGPRCSQCPRQASFCNDGLCSTKSSGSNTTVPATSRGIETSRTTGFTPTTKPCVCSSAAIVAKSAVFVTLALIISVAFDWIATN